MIQFTHIQHNINHLKSSHRISEISVRLGAPSWTTFLLCLSVWQRTAWKMRMFDEEIIWLPGKILCVRAKNRQGLLENGMFLTNR